MLNEFIEGANTDGKAHGEIVLIIKSSIRHYQVSTKENSCKLALWSKTGMVISLFQSYTRRISIL
jgi:hypothetical protein